jgi:hypothetical protein
MFGFLGLGISCEVVCPTPVLSTAEIAWIDLKGLGTLWELTLLYKPLVLKKRLVLQGNITLVLTYNASQNCSSVGKIYL